MLQLLKFLSKHEPKIKASNAWKQALSNEILVVKMYFNKTDSEKF